ncbi:MAG TPA: hypothetical protein VFS37_09670, partial [Conexibacter sp.]|nr:hypothetical protein [Conexibacter sp.]
EDSSAVAHGAGGTYWFGRPSYFGVWVADQPWGPWRQIHEDVAWTPADDPAARCYETRIVPKWIAEDGTSFWLVWTDFQRPPSPVSDEDYQRELKRLVADRRIEEAARLHVERMPHYGMNAQKVELVV